MADGRQTTLDELIERAEERERLAAQTVRSTKAVRCPFVRAESVE